MKIEKGMEVRVTIPEGEGQFCNVAEVIEPYGHCDVCKERFTYGNDHLKISVIANGKSQGHPSQFARKEILVHLTCFTPELISILS